LLGHVTYGNLTPASAIVALCFTLAFYRFSVLYRRTAGLSQGLLWQGLAVASLILVGQPVAAATTALLATSQVLLSPLLQTAHERYFRAIQFQLLLSTLLTALALGYRP
jgi:urea transporter